MRVALVGDLQYGSIEKENIIPKLGQIASLDPDFAVIMGDTGGPKCASIDGYRDTAELAKNLKCPYHLILGNHDVECSPEDYDSFDPISDYKEIFGTGHYRSFVLNGVLLLCVSVEKQPKEMMRTVHGVYVSDEQFRWVENELISHNGMPTVIVAHAPVIGNGLR
ncbi:MAG: metallophosphoesterase, partial [Clostridia bacterium]|nr:metallophosphoesterase [Clostridia bacterium]MBR5454154.1 metallophosphoesterase [Clostridia bacterium]